MKLLRFKIAGKYYTLEPAEYIAQALEVSVEEAATILSKVAPDAAAEEAPAADAEPEANTEEENKEAEEGAEG